MTGGGRIPTSKPSYFTWRKKAVLGTCRTPNRSLSPTSCVLASSPTMQLKAESARLLSLGVSGLNPPPPQTHPLSSSRVTRGMPQVVTDPTAKPRVLFQRETRRGWELWVSAVCAPAFLSSAEAPSKCWFRVKAKAQSPPAGPPSLWQLNKNQCKLLIGSLIIDAVFTTI